MEAMRQSWTDDRLDGFGRRIDQRFDHVDENIKGLRADFNVLRQENHALQMTMMRVGGAIVVALMGLTIAGQI